LFGWSAGVCSPLVPEVTVAFSVGRWVISGAIELASELLDEPEFVTAWHTPPLTPSHDPLE
jgi:uncharacterized Rmd1/YagE family protein